MYKYALICYTIITNTYKELRYFPLKRIVEVLNFIKVKNIVVEFNVYNVVSFFSKMMSHQLSDAQERKEVEEIWEYVVEEGNLKNNGKRFFGGEEL